MDPHAVPMLAGCADNIAAWSDRYTPPAEEANERLGAFPYLAPDFAFVEKRPGETPWIRDIHLFGIGASMSFGPSGSSINAMAIAAPRLHAELEAYDLPQVVLDEGKLAVG